MINVNLPTVDITQNTMDDIEVSPYSSLWILITQVYLPPRIKVTKTKFDIYIGRIIRDYTHCSQLYCWDDLTLLLKTLPGAPALPGTRCDMGRICYMGRCIDEALIGPTEKPTKNPSTVPGVIQNVCDSINNFVTSIINIFGWHTLLSMSIFVYRASHKINFKCINKSMLKYDNNFDDLFNLKCIIIFQLREQPILVNMASIRNFELINDQSFQR